MKSPIRTTTQLARSLNLSRWTISRALNGQPGVGAKTVARIQAAARTGGFAPSQLGRGLRSGGTNQVGVCLPGLDDYFLTPKITLLHENLQSLGLQPLLRIVDGTPEDENAALERFAAMRCAGVVGIASRLLGSDPGPRCLTTAGIPLINIDPLQKLDGPCILTDRRAAMRALLAFLHKLGHRRLVAAGFSRTGSYSKQKIAGLQEGCRALKWNFQRDIVLLECPSDENSFAMGAHLADAWRKHHSKNSAILAINDQVALGLMRRLQDHGVRVPEDVSIIGYDNRAFSPFAGPPLTTIDPQIELLIAHAVKPLTPGSSKNRPHDVKPILVRPRLIERASHGPPPLSRKKI